MTDKILLRSTVSGVTSAFDADYGRRLLADPFFAKTLVEVESEKPEVLSQPYEIDGEGNRNVIDHDDTDTNEDGEEIIFPFADPDRAETMADDVKAYEDFVTDKTEES